MYEKVAEQSIPDIFPPCVQPAGGLAYFSSGLDVVPFGDSYLLDVNMQFPPTPPLGNHESPLLSNDSSPLLTPPRSPVVFTNPWTTFLASCSLDNELDEFSVQPIHAAPTPVPSLYSPGKGHTRYTPLEIDPIAKDGQQPEVNLDDWIHFNQL